MMASHRLWTIEECMMIGAKHMQRVVDCFNDMFLGPQ